MNGLLVMMNAMLILWNMNAVAFIITTIWTLLEIETTIAFGIVLNANIKIIGHKTTKNIIEKVEGLTEICQPRAI